MKVKKQTNMMKWLIFLVICFMPVFIYADMGPKPRTTIKIINPPKGMYFIDLLMDKGDIDTDYTSQIPDDYNDKQKQLLCTLLNYQDENGWKPRGDKIPGRLDIHPNDISDEYTFSYMNVPEEFKIIIVTTDNQVHISPVIHKRAFEETMTYDFATGKIKQKIIAVAYLLQFLMTCIPTLLIEGGVLKGFGFSLKTNLKVFLLTNIGTQLLMTVIMTPVLLQGGLLIGYFYFILMELVIMIIESVIYAFKLVGDKRGHRIAYGITANLLSALVGFFGFVFQYAVVNL